MIMFSFGRMIYESEVELISESSPRFISVKYSPSSVQSIKDSNYFDEIGSELMSTVILRNNGRTPARDMFINLRVPTVRTVFFSTVLQIIKFIKKHHLLYPVSAHVYTREGLIDCIIKNAEFNPNELQHRTRRDATESPISDMFVRYTPEVSCLP